MYNNENERRQKFVIQNEIKFHLFFLVQFFLLFYFFETYTQWDVTRFNGLMILKKIF